MTPRPPGPMRGFKTASLPHQCPATISIIITRRTTYLIRVRLIRFRSRHGAMKVIGDSKRSAQRVSEQAVPRNVLGPALRQIRLSREWTLQQVAERLRSEGLICSVKRLGRIEAQLVAIKDFEVLYFSAALSVTQEELWKRRASLRQK